MRVLQLSASLQGYSRTKDRCVTLRHKSSIEVDSDVIKDIDSFMNKEIWLMMSESLIQDGDIPEEAAPTDGKTQAQRIRGVLFVYWKQLTEKGDIRDDFQTFYNYKTEQIIEHLKSKLL